MSKPKPPRGVVPPMPVASEAQRSAIRRALDGLGALKG